MKLPKRNIEDFAQELIDDCNVSRSQRISNNQLWKSLYFNGSANNESDAAIYNKTYAYIDEQHSMLYSPSDVKFNIVFDHTSGAEYISRAKTASSFLNRRFADGDCDTAAGTAILWGLIKGCAFVKQLWGPDGLDPYVIQPEYIGVLNETINGLDRQEAFVHTTFLSPAQVRRQVAEHPDKEKIMKEVNAAKQMQADAEESEENFFHQIVIGGTTPVATQGPTSPAGGVVGVTGGPISQISPEVAADLVRQDEIWVLDDERKDYTTIQMLAGKVCIEGKLERRNLCGVEGEQPFRQFCPEAVDGYFWGRSAIAGVMPLQTLLNRRLRDFNRIWKLQARSPKAYIGFSGMTPEKHRKLNAPGGYISEDTPNGKIEDLAPKLPEGAFDETLELLQFFDDMAGSRPITKGRGEGSVRSGSHAQTLMRSASGRIRDRALTVERQLEDLGDFCFKVLQAKTPTAFKSEKGEEFLLDQIPDDYRVKVDSHSASPAFSEDNKELAFDLAKLGAIGPVELIMLTNPPQQDMLIAAVKEKQAAAAKFAEEHPEAAQSKGGKKR